MKSIFRVSWFMFISGSALGALEPLLRATISFHLLHVYFWRNLRTGRSILARMSDCTLRCTVDYIGCYMVIIYKDRRDNSQVVVLSMNQILYTAPNYFCLLASFLTVP